MRHSYVWVPLLLLGVLSVINRGPEAGAAISKYRPDHSGIPELGAREHGFPLPQGARRNDSLGGATSVAPGRNYTLSVYDVDSGIDVMTAFYAHHLPEAKRVSEAQEVRFTTPGGHVRLARIGQRTRITLVIGPR